MTRKDITKASTPRPGKDRRLVLTQTEIERFIVRLRASGAHHVVLPLLMIIEDVLSDRDIGASEWKAGAEYLASETSREGLKHLMNRVARAMRDGNPGRQAARRTLVRLIQIGYGDDAPGTGRGGKDDSTFLEELREWHGSSAAMAETEDTPQDA